MIKGVKGEEFKHWIDQVNPNITKLCKKLNIPQRTFYHNYTKEIIEWSYVNRVHNYLKELYDYDINQFFSNHEEFEYYLVEERNNMQYGEPATVKALRVDLERMQNENTEMLKKLNTVYEQLLDRRYYEMIDIIKENNVKMQHFIDKFEQK